MITKRGENNKSKKEGRRKLEIKSSRRKKMEISNRRK